MNGIPTKISALAIIYNEEHNIREYLQNMSFADEIVVVDSFSTDKTPDIIKQEFPHVRFYQRVFDDFSSQRNYTIELASNDWVVFFDADERVSKKGIAEIVKKINSTPEEVAFWVKRIFYYEGRPLVNNRFNTDRTVRIFRKSKCHYSRKLVHEKLVIDGKTGLLKTAIDHYSFTTREEFLNKRLMYSELKAKELLDKGIEATSYHFIIRPKFRFFKYYILKLGLLNGKRGYDIAKILSHDEYMRYVYLTDMQKAQPQAPKYKILVIQQKMIGDVLVSTIICNNLKAAYPNSSIEYLIYPFTSPVVQNNPFINKVLLFENKYRDSKWEFFKFLSGIRKEKYDIVIDAYGKLESNLVTLFSGAHKRIGYGEKEKLFAYNNKVAHPDVPKSTDGLAIERRENLFKDLMHGTPIDNRPKLFVTSQEIDNAKQLLQSFDINAEQTNVIMLSILGSEKNKTYPIPYMVELINFVAKTPNVTLLFNYTPAQAERIDEIYNLCSEEAQAKTELNVIGKDIRSFIAIMQLCKMHIGNDGGAINIAKALNKPTFTIFSPWIQKESWSIFEDGVFNKAVHVNDFYPEIIATTSTKKLKKKYDHYYTFLKPSLIFDSLKQFLDTHLSN
jgi:heptosyltransferase-2